MQKSSHDHQPQRFEVYKETKDGKGFTVKGSNFVYKFDSFGGWKDEYGNYYNCNGEPEEEPAQGAYTPQELSEEQPEHDDYDEYQKQYGPSIIDDDHQDDHLDRGHIKNMHTIAQNVGLLATFPSKMPLRVYFELKNNTLSEKQLYDNFYPKCKGIINVICQHKQGGHFVVDSTDAAEKIIKCEGDFVGKFPIRFSLQTLEELLLQPLTQHQLKSNIKQANSEKKFKPAEQKKEKPKFLGKNEKKEQSPIKTKQEKKQEQPHELKAAEQFKLYWFNITAFKKKQDFKLFMQSLKLQSEIDYKNAKNLTRKQDGLKYGQVEMLPSAMNKANHQKFNGEQIQFKPIVN